MLATREFLTSKRGNAVGSLGKRIERPKKALRVLVQDSSAPMALSRRSSTESENLTYHLTAPGRSIPGRGAGCQVGGKVSDLLPKVQRSCLAKRTRKTRRRKRAPHPQTAELKAPKGGTLAFVCTSWFDRFNSFWRNVYVCPLTFTRSLPFRTAGSRQSVGYSLN